MLTNGFGVGHSGMSEMRCDGSGDGRVQARRTTCRRFAHPRSCRDGSCRCGVVDVALSLQLSEQIGGQIKQTRSTKACVMFSVLGRFVGGHGVGVTRIATATAVQRAEGIISALHRKLEIEKRALRNEALAASSHRHYQSASSGPSSLLDSPMPSASSCCCCIIIVVLVLAV